MRRPVDTQSLDQFMRELGAQARSPGTVYLTGGSTALLLGIRGQTVDVDVKLDPEPAGALEAIAMLKETLGINVELAAPDQFIPPLPGWRERSIFIAAYGKVTFKHFDLYSQALSKIERGYALDLADASQYVERGLVELEELLRLFREIIPDLIRYPAIDPAAFERKVAEFVRSHESL